MELKSEEYIPAERLDELLEVTTPKGWIGLVGIILLLIFVSLWLFLGKIPTRVTGTGMLIKAGGIQTITSVSSGRIEKIAIKVGDSVTQGQPLIFISQLELRNKIEDLKKKIEEQKITNQEREEIRSVLAVKYNEELEGLRKKLESQLKLLRSGVTLEREAFETNIRLTEVDRKIEELKVERLNDRHLLNGFKRELRSLEEKHEQNSVVRSLYDGVVIELKENVGNVVKSGTQLLSIENMDQASHHLEGIVYISALDGKRVSPGMEVRIIPSSIKPEEYGSLLGKIHTASLYPATYQGMVRVLHNEELVKQILSKGSQIEVQVKLIANKKTISGLQWTTKEGPPIKIQSGTLCEARITVEEKRPIQLIIPKLKEWLGTEK